MKKVLLMLGMLAFSALIVAFNQVSGETTIPVTTTTIINTESETTNVYRFEDQYYTYTSYQDLVDQIYEDIYQDVHDQIQSEVINQLTDQYYESIYAQVQADLIALLDDEQFDVYVDDFQDQIHEVVAIGEKSVFGVTNTRENEEVTVGSGVVYKHDSDTDTYYMITNYHVVEDGIKQEIYLPDETRVEASLLGYDEEVDIAILTFSGFGLSDIVVSSLGESASIEIGEFVLAVGNPIGYNFYNSVTMGIVSGLNRKLDKNRFINYIQHDAAINGGNSGGPIYNLDGEVIGINVSKLANIEIEGMGFALPIDLVKRIIERVEAGQLLQHTIMPRLGATYYFVQDKIDGTDINVEKIIVDGNVIFDVTIPLPDGVTEGMILKEIEPGLTLDGRLKSADLIIAIDGFMVTDEISFLDYVNANYESGDQINISYYVFDSVNYEYLDEIQTITVRLK